MATPEYLTIAQVAVKLGLTYDVAVRAIRSGHLPSIRVGARVLVPATAAIRTPPVERRDSGEDGKLAGYLTVAQAAAKLGVTYAQCSKYVRDGRLPSIELGVKLVPESAVNSFRRPARGNPNFGKSV